MSKKSVLVGFARLLITWIVPRCSIIKSRLVSPGGEAIPTGKCNSRPEKASAVVYPKTGGWDGIANVLFGTRSRGAASKLVVHIQITQIPAIRQKAVIVNSRQSAFLRSGIVVLSRQRIAHSFWTRQPSIVWRSDLKSGDELTIRSYTIIGQSIKADPPQ